MPKKVLIAIPVRSRFGQPCYKTQQCLELMRKQTAHTTQVFLAGGQQISQNSLTICNKMLAEDWDYLLYTGDDIIFPPWALDRLIGHDKDFVSGVCTWKSPPYMVPVMKDDVDGKSKHLLIHPENVAKQELIEVDGVGSGFILVKRRVLENIRDYMRDKVYPIFSGDAKWFAPIPFFGVTVNSETGDLMGSDFHFSKQAKLAGARIFIDCGLICRHRWEAEYDITNHWAWMERYGGQMEEEKYFGDRLPYMPFNEDSIYWGEQGPPVHITVTSTGNIYHATEHVCPALGCFWEPIETEGKAKTSAGYVIGWHIGDDVSWHTYTNWANRYERVLVHWVGTDILNIPIWMNSHERTAHMNHPRFVHLVEEERLVPELREYFENVHVCPIPTLRSYPVQPLPKEFAVAVYYPKHRHDFHYGDVVREVIERMPDVQFHLYHLYGEKPDFEYPNMKWLGKLDDNQYPNMLANSSCMLRLSKHDGRPFSIIEAFIMGRRCITNFNMPFVEQVGDVPNAEEVIGKIEKIRKEREPDQAASDFYREENDFKKYKSEIRSLTGFGITAIGGYDYRIYWDNRWTDKNGRIPVEPTINNYVNEITKDVISETDSESILDVGCGSMSRWDKLPIDADKYVGVDVSPNAVKMASERFPEATFFVADITKDTLPVKDIVIANSVLPHIKPEHFLTTVKKLVKLARKAVVFSHTPNVSGGGYQYKLPPVNEWRLGNSWSIETKPVEGSSIEIVVLKKGAPVLAK